MWEVEIGSFLHFPFTSLEFTRAINQKKGISWGVKLSIQRISNSFVKFCFFSLINFSFEFIPKKISNTEFNMKTNEQRPNLYLRDRIWRRTLCGPIPTRSTYLWSTATFHYLDRATFAVSQFPLNCPRDAAPASVEPYKMSVIWQQEVGAAGLDVAAASYSVDRSALKITMFTADTLPQFHAIWVSRFLKSRHHMNLWSTSAARKPTSAHRQC